MFMACTVSPGPGRDFISFHTRKETKGVLKSEVQHPDSYKVLPWKNNINNSSLKSG
jgi:hypothetical protein